MLQFYDSRYSMVLFLSTFCCLSLIFGVETRDTYLPKLEWLKSARIRCWLMLLLIKILFPSCGYSFFRSLPCYVLIARLLRISLSSLSLSSKKKRNDCCEQVKTQLSPKGRSHPTHIAEPEKRALGARTEPSIKPSKY